MPQYTQYQPKEHRPKMSAYWYLDHWHYLRYALRESSSFFVAYFCVITLVQLAALGTNATRYAHFEAFMAHPVMIIINAIALAFFLLHAITWFNLVPRVVMRQMLARPTPDVISSAPNYFVWFGATIILALFILGVL